MAGNFTPGTGADFHYRGTTDGGAPTTGDFVLGDWLETPTGIIVCQVGGSGAAAVFGDLALTKSGATVPLPNPTAKTAAYTAVHGDLVLANANTRQVNDGVTNSTTTLTSATAAFVAGDIGKVISGSGITPGTTIASVTNGTTVVLSAAATATASSVTIVIGGFTVTLPAVSAGRMVTVKKTDLSGGPISIVPASGTIDGATVQQLTVQYQSLDFVSDGANWYIV